MFSQIFFLILVLIIASGAPDAVHPYWTLTPTQTVLTALLSLFGVYGIIALQNIFFRLKKRTLGTFQILANLELIAYLLFFHFFLTAHTLVNTSSEFIYGLLTLSIYFGGMAVFHFTSCNHPPRLLYTYHNVRFLMVFIVPYLILTLLTDALMGLPDEAFLFLAGYEEYWMVGLSLLIISSIVFIYPILIQRIWKCTPLPSSELKDRLDALCQRAKFRHGGMKVWTIMSHAITAAIIGVIPRFRYVMFTQKLLDRLSPEEIEAILAHEMGHSRRKHLLIFPFIIFGMIVSGALFFVFFGEQIYAYYDALQLHPNLHIVLEPLVLFIPYAIILGIYFRFVFGYFSRIFERQADLSCFDLDVPPNQMIAALDHLGIAAGNIHSHPSWHHYSIAQRINFLEKAQANPALIPKHHRKVYISLILYFVCLFIGLFVLYL